MKISIFGLGYVGAVTMGCLARRGHAVCGVDVNPQKVALLKTGASPIVEPGLEALLKGALEKGLLTATTSAADAVRDSDLSIVCVGTPSGAGGEIDLSHVQGVSRQIADAIRAKHGRHELVFRSTMLPGSTESLVAAFFADLVKAGKMSVFFYPEFLREGTAVRDFDEPSLAVIGSLDGAEPPAVVRELVGPATVATWRTAELIKYACNAFHATKVAFANEIGRLGKSAGIDAQVVMDLLCRDKVLNLSPYYLRPGNPFGGSCLPKDVQAMQAFARSQRARLPLLDSLMPSNREHLDALIQRIHRSGEREVIILGLSFKPDTDDLRGSAMVDVVRDLIPSGRTVRIYDPNLRPDRLIGVNMQVIQDKLPGFAGLLCSSLADAMGRHGLIVAAQKCVTIDELRPHVTSQHRVLDINGWPELKTLPATYDGFCW